MEARKPMGDDKWLCAKCKKRERENIDGDWMWYCGPCNDRDYEQYQERQEWEHYHPVGGTITDDK